MYAYTIVCILHILQKNALKPKTRSPGHPFSCAHLLKLFLGLLPLKALLNLPSIKAKRFYHRLFTPLVTLWYFVFQRLTDDHSLEACLCDAFSGGADALNEKLASQLRSQSTASLSDARQNIPWQFFEDVLRLQARRIGQWTSSALWHGRLVALMDGSTVRLRPFASIAKTFAPHRNQKSQAYWCLMRVVVTFCARSGAALDCAMETMDRSEQALACRLIARAVGPHLLVGDRNFGIFRIVQTASLAGHDVLFRLTKSRARKLLGAPLRQGSYAVKWKPSRHDQLEDSCSTQPVAGRLIVATVQTVQGRFQQLYLFTSLPDTCEFSMEELVRLYGLRWHVELNLRYLKDQMDLAQLECKSADMARKEWLAGLLAYNLIRAAQLCAGLKKGIDPLTLSFSSARRRLEVWLAHFGRKSCGIVASWTQMLDALGRCRRARRRKPRPNEPRAQRHLRQNFPPLHGSRAKARRRLGKYASKS